MADLIYRKTALSAKSLWLQFGPMGEVESVSNEPLDGHSKWINADALAALPARGVGVEDRAGKLRQAIAYAMTELAQSAQDAPAMRAEAALIRAFKADAALAPTDSAHVNKTPKSEHDAGDVLTAAQAREAALDAIKLGFLSAAPGEWRVSDIERVTEAILRALEQEGRDG